MQSGARKEAPQGSPGSGLGPGRRPLRYAAWPLASLVAAAPVHLGQRARGQPVVVVVVVVAGAVVVRGGGGGIVGLGAPKSELTR